MENENCILKEDLEKAKDDIVVKSKVIEGNIARINTVEEDLKRKSDRISILEPAVNRILSKNYKSPPRKDSKEVVNYKDEVKAKNQIIKQLNEDKNKLANELKETQEKLHSNMDTDKCIKLTANLNAVKSESKALERERRKT